LKVSFAKLDVACFASDIASLYLPASSAILVN
jgi:hypothetical protein